MNQDVRDRIAAELLYIQWKLIDRKDVNDPATLRKLQEQYGRLNGQLIRDGEEFRLEFELERRYLALVRDTETHYARKNHARTDYRSSSNVLISAEEIRRKIDPRIYNAIDQKRRALESK